MQLANGYWLLAAGNWRLAICIDLWLKAKHFINLLIASS